jgi:histone acetyltransferase (RNA polymerase elongator complex component)
MIIPFFLPHAGCPHQCVFCNQKHITGRHDPIDPRSIPRQIDRYLAGSPSSGTAEIAFYGGSFTALPVETQTACLQAALPFVQTGRIKGIRCSTRPDRIDSAALALLREYPVHTVELGAQSMDDRVLALSGRGHTAGDTRNAAIMLKDHGFTVGLQVMPGLPGDSADSFEHTIDQVVELKPAFVRLYPALVIKDTPLAELYRRGEYTPLSLDEAVAWCCKAAVKLRREGIDVIRMGLQPTAVLETPGTVLAGPYHPAFGQLVESTLMLEGMRAALRKRRDTAATAVFLVHPRDISTAIGHQRGNIKALKKEFWLREIRIKGDDAIGRRGETALLTE